MSVELPKDAEGREIPLDTVVLFSHSGEAHNIVRWIYTTDFETWTESNMWRAIAENHRALDPELMYLTPPDTWEKLEEDFDRCIEMDSLCGYYSPSGDCCDCAIINTDDDCECGPTFKSIKDRIRKLRGEDDA